MYISAIYQLYFCNYNKLSGVKNKVEVVENMELMQWIRYVNFYCIYNKW